MLENDFKDFIKTHENKVVNLTKETNLAYFDASIRGKPEDYEKVSELQLKLETIYTNKDEFKQLQDFKNSDIIEDEFLKRQLELIYNDYAGSQISENLLKEIIDLSTKIEKEFATFRANVDDKDLTDNEIDKILDNSTDSAELEKVWSASKQVGHSVANDVIKLAKLRNKSAKELGFENYHQMSLELSEQSQSQLDSLFDELNELTEREFVRLKKDIDSYLAKKYNIDKNKLMPWHYQDKFFQQGPKIYNVDLDKYFENKDIVKITSEYFNNVGLNIDDLIEKSDLFEKEGKYQHAYCTDIDRNGDIRVLCNIKPNMRWMGTMLHEYGHAAYDKFVSHKLPWRLRQHAHIFTTEAIAMLFGRFALNPTWLHDIIGISSKEKESIADECRKSLKLEQLIFSRWVQVIYRFEKAMYANPDQDLNMLWWNLVEKYQQLKRPEGELKADWAAKIHIALYPAYYHNYMLGELLASQLYFYIKDKVLKLEEPETSFNNQSDVGEYLKNLFFAPGALYRWDKLIEKSTGEKLSAKFYAQQFVNG